MLNDDDIEYLRKLGFEPVVTSHGVVVNKIPEDLSKVERLVINNQSITHSVEIDSFQDIKDDGACLK